MHINVNSTETHILHRGNITAGRGALTRQVNRIDGRSAAISMKVCFIAGTLGRGGAERQLLYMLRALQGSGIDARVLCLTRGEAYEDEIRRLGVEVEWVGTSNNRVARLLKIIANIRKRPADIIQSVHFYTNIYAGSAGRVLRIANIGAIRSDLSFELTQNNLFGKLQLKLPAHLIANSDVARNRAIKHGIKPERIDFLCNAVDLPLEPVKELSRDYVSILFAGRLSKEKRPELFVDLAERLKQHRPDVGLQFVIAGDGPLREDLEIRVQAAGLSNSFSFLGQHESMDDVYRRTDVLVLTSEHEGTPNVILEAMAYGVPVAATDVGGVKNILTADRGFLIDASDPNDLFNAVAALVEDPRLRKRLGNAGQQFVGSDHSLQSLGASLTGIYSRLLGGGQ